MKNQTDSRCRRPIIRLEHSNQTRPGRDVPSHAAGGTWRSGLKGDDPIVSAFGRDLRSARRKGPPYLGQGHPIPSDYRTHHGFAVKLPAVVNSTINIKHIATSQTEQRK